MKKDIHPEYHSNAVIKCACGNQIKAGSTVEKTEIGICSACHPFFTGKKKVIDTAGRVEKFKAKIKKAAKKEEAEISVRDALGGEDTEKKDIKEDKSEQAKKIEKEKILVENIRKLVETSSQDINICNNIYQG